MITANDLENKLKYLSLTDNDIPILLDTIDQHADELDKDIKAFIDAFYYDYAKKTKLLYDTGNGYFYTKNYCKVLAKEDEYTSIREYYRDLLDDPFSPCQLVYKESNPELQLMLCMDIFSLLDMKDEYNYCHDLYNQML